MIWYAPLSYTKFPCNWICFWNFYVPLVCLFMDHFHIALHAEAWWCIMILHRLRPSPLPFKNFLSYYSLFFRIHVNFRIKCLAPREKCKLVFDYIQSIHWFRKNGRVYNVEWVHPWTRSIFLIVQVYFVSFRSVL